MSDTALPPLRRKEEIQPVELPGVNALMTLAVGVVVIAALYIAREVFIPITLAVLLSFVLAPLVGLLRRWHLGRLPSVILAVLFSLGIIALLSGVIGTQIAQLAGDIPRYATTIESKVSAIRGLAGGHLFSMIGGIGKRIEMAGSPVASATPEGGQPAAQPPMPVEVRQPPATPLVIVEQILLPVLSPLATVAIMFVVAIFITLATGSSSSRPDDTRLFGTDDLHRSTRALDDAAYRLSRYFLTQLALNTAFGVIIGVGLLIIGVPNPVLWGIIAALFRFVPYVGSYLAAALPLLLAASVEPGWTMLFYGPPHFTLYLKLSRVRWWNHWCTGAAPGFRRYRVVVSAIFLGMALGSSWADIIDATYALLWWCWDVM